MTISEYEALTGKTVPASKQSIVEATIATVQSMLEGMLGFTLDPAKVNDNQYVESGKTPIDCPCTCTVDEDTLLPPDPIVVAYRQFSYCPKDKYFAIDPCTAVHAVKLVKGTVTYKTLDPSEYRLDYKLGYIKYLEDCECWCCCNDNCKCVQLAVDATWVWDDANDIPDDLNQIWASMVTYFSNPSGNIKSQTLGSHSYTKFSNVDPFIQAQWNAVILKYAGPNSDIREKKTVTVC